MAWKQVETEVLGTVALDGETRRCRLIERDDDEGVVRLSVLEAEPSAPGSAGEFVIAVSADRFTPDPDR